MFHYILDLFIIVIIIFPFYALLRRPWKYEAGREWALAGFTLFMLALLALALDGNYTHPAAMLQSAGQRLSAKTRINLIPFRSIRTFFRHFQFDLFMVNIVGNIVMFIPWGFGLPFLWKKRQSVFSAVVFSALLPLCIETIQLFIGRSVDVDDLILNFAGGMLGFSIYLFSRKYINTDIAQ